MKTVLKWLVVAHLAMTGLAHGQEKDPWVGKRVFTKFGTVLKVGDAVVDDERRSDSITVTGKDRKDVRVYRVEQTNGEWLWLKDEKSGIRGWVHSKYVIPYEQAIDFYTNQIRSAPAGILYSGRACVWLEMKEYEKAIADLNEAIRAEPTDSAHYNSRGGVWMRKGDYEKSLADFDEAIRREPRYASAYHNRGMLWRNKNEIDKAITDFNKAIQLDSKYALAYLNRGVTWSRKKEFDKAIVDYNQAIHLDPNDSDKFFKRSTAWFIKKEFGKAIADCNEAIRLDPKYAAAYCSRAWVWATCPDEKYRDGKRAVESAIRACEFNEWKDPNDLDTLAAAYAENGDFEKAVETQEKAIKLKPSPEELQGYEDHLRLYKEKRPLRDTAS